MIGFLNKLERLVRDGISLSENNREYIAKTNIRNNDRKIRNLGITLWQISLGVIQKFVNKYNHPIVHEVIVERSGSLGIDKWEIIFEPLLKKYGYIKLEDDVGVYCWEHTYDPKPLVIND